MRKAWWILLLFPISGVAADTGDEEEALFDQLGTREQILDMQREVAEAGTRRRALLAYRMARHRELGFTVDPEGRLEDASAFDMALIALRRSVDETKALARELDRVRADRTAMESALVTRALGATRKADAQDWRSEPLVRPLRGSPVALPGVRRDGPTRVELRHDSVDLLARLNDPVRSIAAGVVQRVELLPQGGFAVVTAHANGLTTIVSGLRDVVVAPKATVGAGQTLGLAGRNLDGAAVVSVEIWRNRRPLDAARLLHIRIGS
jgi:murein DD-endopeptidase MepM/ murein hydrolase activator NlpD